MLRTFIAVDVSAAVRRRAGELIAQLQGTQANVKWVATENMHWTLKFLGETRSRDVPDVCSAVADAVRPLSPFALHAGGAGAFPTASRPRTVWLGVSGGEAQMVQLHDAIDEALSELGYRSEHRRFQPHLTIGRVRRSPRGILELGTLITEQAEFDAGEMPVAEVVFFSSQLKPSGPVYQTLGRAELLG